MKQASQWWTKVSKIAAPGQAGIQKLPEHVDATDDIGNLPSIAVLDPWFKVVFNKKQSGKPNFILQPPEFLVLMPPACSLWLGQSISTADGSHQPGQLHLCRTRCYHGPQLPHGESVQVKLGLVFMCSQECLRCLFGSCFNTAPSNYSIWRMNLPTWVWMSCFCPEIRKEQWFHKKDCAFLIIGHSSTNFPDSQGMLGTTGSPRMKSRHETHRLIMFHFRRLESREDAVVKKTCHWTGEFRSYKRRGTKIQKLGPQSKLYSFVQMSCFHGVPNAFWGADFKQDTVNQSSSRDYPTTENKLLFWNHHCRTKKELGIVKTMAASFCTFHHLAQKGVVSTPISWFMTGRR